MRLVDDPSNIEEGGLLRQREIERNEILRGQEELWRLRSKAIWLSSGDSNSKFFHRVASNNRSRKHIWEISDDSGSIFTEQEAIKAETFHHFKNFYKAGDVLNTIEQFQLVDLYPWMVSYDESNSLLNPMTLEELKQVLFKFKKEKSPGPDGWSSEFFTFFFDIVGEDLLDMVEEARRFGVMVSSLNSTFITLILKANKPITFDDFQLISLCNLCYKIISKIIANRIKPVLSKFRSSEQLGFLQGGYRMQ